MTREDGFDAAIRLLSVCRWGALATLRNDGSPLASQVAVAVDRGAGELLMHLSSLAEHTRNLARNPAASILLAEPDDGRADPQELARISLVGEVRLLARDDPAHDASRRCYLARLPQAEPRFEFGDFNLYALRPARAQFVGGFARAFSFKQTEAERLLREVGA